MCKLFVIDGILSGWSRRKYVSESERWRLLLSAVSLLLATVSCDSNSIGLRLIAHLLTPTPATGAAPQPLRALLAAYSVQRAADEHERNSKALGLGRLIEAVEMHNAQLCRLLEKSAAKSAKILYHALSLSQARIARMGLPIATCIELISAESHACQLHQPLRINLICPIFLCFEQAMTKRQ